MPDGAGKREGRQLLQARCHNQFHTRFLNGSVLRLSNSPREMMRSMQSAFKRVAPRYSSPDDVLGCGPQSGGCL